MSELQRQPNTADVKNPKRIAAGKLNRAKAQVTEATRQKLREAILARKPWEQSTGPKSAQGKQKVSTNKKHQANDTEALIASVKSYAQLLGKLRHTGYVDVEATELRTTDQLATELETHLRETYGTWIQRLAERAKQA